MERYVSQALRVDIAGEVIFILFFVNFVLFNFVFVLMVHVSSGFMFQ